MVGFLGAISSGIHGITNQMRETLLTPEEKKGRETARQTVELAKLASLVAVAVALLFLAIFPKLITLFLTALICFVAREVFTAASNGSEMLDSAIVEAQARLNKETLINQMAKNTYVAGSIFRVINPDLSGVVAFPG